MMRPNIFWWMLALIVLTAVPVSGLGIDTLYVSDTVLCGENPSSTRAFAIGISNDLETTITNLTLSLVSHETLNITPTLPHRIPQMLPAGYISSREWTINCKGSQSGEYTVWLNYSYWNGTQLITGTTQDDLTSSVTLDTAYPSIEGLAPVGYVNSTHVELEVVTAEDAHCRYHTYDVPYSMMLFDMNGDELTHTYPLNAGSGSYTYYVRCSDSDGNVNPWSSIISFTVDQVSPTITITSPVGRQIDTSVKIDVETNEKTTCRYTFSGSSWEDMEYDFQYYDEDHVISHSLSEGDYDLTVACQDAAGNTEQASTSFSVAMPPKATITLSPHSPLQPGLVKISLVTDKPVRAYPSLSYTFDGSADTPRSISLEGTDTHWKGYMIMGESGDRRIGSFEFSATSIEGVSGNQIEEGRIFILDDQEPTAPLDVQVRLNSAGRAVLEWHSTAEDITSYTIYRSEEPHVSYADHHASSQSRRFIDDVVDGKTYYYRITATDDAGNEGPLSSEVQIRTSSYVEQEVKQHDPRVNKTVALERSLLEVVDAKIKKVDSLILDVEAAEVALYDLRTDVKALAEQLDLYSRVQLSKEDLQDIRSSLVELRFDETKADQVEQELHKQDLLMKKIQLATPKQVSLIRKSELEEIASERIISLAVAGNKGTSSSEELAASTDATISFMGGVQVSKVLSQVEVSYLDNSIKNYVLETKHVAIRNSTHVSGTFLEVFPDSFEGEQIHFEGKQVLLGETPVVYTLPLSPDVNSYSLYVEGDLFDELKEARAVIIPADVSVRPQTQNETELVDITGFAAGVKGLGVSISTLLLPLVIGAGIILVLITYYFLMLHRKRRRKHFKEGLSEELQTLHSMNLTSETTQEDDVFSTRTPEPAIDSELPSSQTNKETNKEAKKTTTHPASQNQHSLKQEVVSLLEKAYQEVKSNRPENSKELYVKILVLYKKLDPESKQLFRERIVQLNYTLNIAHIHHLLSEGLTSLNHHDLAGASQMYGQIKEIYEKLPRELKSKIITPSMKFYHRLSWQKTFK